MRPQLRATLIKLGASGAGAIAIAGALMVNWEGREYTPYVDPVGVLTVCAGITGPDVIRGKRYTPAECDALEAKHLAVAERAAKRQLVHYESYNRWRQAALIDFTYNLGEGNLSRSTLKRKFNAGDEVGGCWELRKWNKGRVRGVLTTLRGLVLRRADEMELCLDWRD